MPDNLLTGRFRCRLLFCRGLPPLTVFAQAIRELRALLRRQRCGEIGNALLDARAQCFIGIACAGKRGIERRAVQLRLAKQAQHVAAPLAARPHIRAAVASRLLQVLRELLPAVVGELAGAFVVSFALLAGSPPTGAMHSATSDAPPLATGFDGTTADWSGE